MEETRLNSECIDCLLNKYLKYIPEDVEENKKVEYMQAVLRIIGNSALSASAPEIVDEISKVQKNILGFVEDFSEIKVFFNDLMMKFEDELNEKVRSADDSLGLAVRLAMTGNYIDFGAVKNVETDKLKELLGNAGAMVIDEIEMERLKNDLEKAKKLVFLTDNCGEIVLDKILLNTIKILYPMIDIHIIVRGKPVLNDVTTEDAVQVGLTELFDVSDNGSSVAGTCLNRISEEAKKKIDDADVIIAKGQGNFETLRFCNKNIYYMFMCKCMMFAKRFGVKQFSGMLVNDLRLR